MHTSAHQFFPLGVLFGCLVCRKLRKVEIWSREKEEFSIKALDEDGCCSALGLTFRSRFRRTEVRKTWAWKTNSHSQTHTQRVEARRVGVDDEQLQSFVCELMPW